MDTCHNLHNRCHCHRRRHRHHHFRLHFHCFVVIVFVIIIVIVMVIIAIIRIIDQLFVFLLRARLRKGVIQSITPRSCLIVYGHRSQMNSVKPQLRA